MFKRGGEVKKLIVLISGKMGSGKTTLSEGLQQKLCVKNVTLQKFASILYEMHDHIIEVAKKYAIIKPDDNTKHKEILQFIGTDYFRKVFGQDVWVKAMVTKLHKVNKPIIIIDDCRFKNELAAFDKDYDVLKIRLECSKEVRKARCDCWRDNDTHPSETDLDFEEFDLMINTERNSSLETLEKAVEVIKETYNKAYKCIQFVKFYTKMFPELGWIVFNPMIAEKVYFIAYLPVTEPA